MIGNIRYRVTVCSILCIMSANIGFLLNLESYKVRKAISRVAKESFNWSWNATTTDSEWKGGNASISVCYQSSHTYNVLTRFAKICHIHTQREGIVFITAVCIHYATAKFTSLLLLKLFQMFTRVLECSLNI